MNKCNERGRQLIVAGSDSGECLHFVDETFHHASLLIGVIVTKPRFGKVLLRLSCVNRSAGSDVLPNFKRTVCAVAKHVTPENRYFL